MKILQLSLLMGLLIGTLACSKVAHAEVLNFSQWKSEKVKQARIRAKKDSKEQSSEQSKPSIFGGQEDEVLKKAKPIPVEVANELGVNDYFILYLVPHEDPKALFEAAKQLKPEEMADLLRAYKRYLGEQSEAVIEFEPTSLVKESTGVGNKGEVEL